MGFDGFFRWFELVVFGLMGDYVIICQKVFRMKIVVFVRFRLIDEWIMMKLCDFYRVM